MSINTHLETVAYWFAHNKHSGQKRKYTGQPYILHPVAVRDILAEAGVTDSEVLCAALLHDTVEDTDATFEEIEKIFGREIMELVWYLTDYKLLQKEGNRATRKLITEIRLSRAPVGAVQIKLADMIDNAKDLSQNDPSFYNNVFKKEKESLYMTLYDALLQGEQYQLSWSTCQLLEKFEESMK